MQSLRSGLSSPSQVAKKLSVVFVSQAQAASKVLAWIVPLSFEQPQGVLR